MIADPRIMTLSVLCVYTFLFFVCYDSPFELIIVMCAWPPACFYAARDCSEFYGGLGVMSFMGARV